MRRRWLRVAVVVGIIALLAAGIRLIAAPTFISSPDTVHIVVTEVQPSTQHQTVIFDHQFSQQATAVYSELVAGGPLTGISSCPAISYNRSYYRYKLTFFHWGVTTATATSDAVGCMFISVQYPLGTTEGYTWFRGNHPSFWVHLYELTNAPQPI